MDRFFNFVVCYSACPPFSPNGGSRGEGTRYGKRQAR
jgi:hypothetical protein